MRRVSKNWLTGVFVLAFGWLLLYATRTVLSSALKEIGDYWNLSQSWLGVLTSSFFFTYTALQIPTGFLSDMLGPRKMLVFGFLVQSVGLVLGSVSQNHMQFLASRLLTGAGQASYFASQQTIVSIMLPIEKKALGTSITVAGAGLGSALGFFVGKMLSAGNHGWRLPFAALGVLSGAFAVAILWAVPGPGVLRGLVASNLESNPKISLTPGVPPVFILCMCGAHFMTMYGFYVMLAWLPYYLETVRGLGKGPATFIPVTMSLALGFATVTGGLLFGKLRDKTWVCKVVLPVSALAIASVPLVKGTWGLLSVLALYGLTGKLVVDPSLVYFVGESCPPEKRGITFAMFNCAGAVAMTVAPAMTGFVSQATGSFDGSFFLAAAFNLLGLGCFLGGVRLFRDLQAGQCMPAKHRL